MTASGVVAGSGARPVASRRASYQGTALSRPNTQALTIKGKTITMRKDSANRRALRRGGAAAKSPSPAPIFKSGRSSRQPRAVMRRGVIHWRAFRDDAGRIDPRNRPVVDHIVARLHRRGDAGHGVKLAHIVQKIWHIRDAAAVA